MTEQEVIEQLSDYKRKQARMKFLSTYSVGAGITVSRLNEDDQLRELHCKLRGLPSYMYLNSKEQELETIAGSYMTYFPAGVKSQYRSIPTQGVDDEDTKLLNELKRKIKKVLAARGYDERNDIDQVLNRLAEYQDLKKEILRIDNILNALEVHKPDYAKLLRMRYIDEIPTTAIASCFSITDRTFRRWNTVAIEEFIKLSA